jgi:hypothetical protein
MYGDVDKVQNSDLSEPDVKGNTMLECVDIPN